jgi:hypothetical protein
MTVLFVVLLPSKIQDWSPTRMQNQTISVKRGKSDLLLTGEDPFAITNAYGFKVELKWIALVSAILSVVSNFTSAWWTMEAIENETNAYTAKLTFVNLLVFRMGVWILIVILLHSFSFVVMIGLFESIFSIQNYYHSQILEFGMK